MAKIRVPDSKAAQAPDLASTPESQARDIHGPSTNVEAIIKFLSLRGIEAFDS
jgi:hypothetical protein